MSQPQVSLPQDRAYPFPWSLPCVASERGIPFKSREPGEGQPGRMVTRQEVIDLWMREFLDERTGGFSPPPMS